MFLINFVNLTSNVIKSKKAFLQTVYFKLQCLDGMYKFQPLFSIFCHLFLNFLFFEDVLTNLAVALQYTLALILFPVQHVLLYFVFCLFLLSFLKKISTLFLQLKSCFLVSWIISTICSPRVRVGQNSVLNMLIFVFFVIFFLFRNL